VKKIVFWGSMIRIRIINDMQLHACVISMKWQRVLYIWMWHSKKNVQHSQQI
jgi:hypothetical protein